MKRVVLLAVLCLMMWVFTACTYIVSCDGAVWADPSQVTLGLICQP